jgi:hypothetical protein
MNSDTQLIHAPISTLYKFDCEKFSSSNPGILFFLPIIKKYSIDTLIKESSYPGTSSIPKLNSILSFIALKLANIERYSYDNVWCMDRGLGLCAGLNVLPKNSWFSSYAFRVTHEDNSNFLKGLHKIWLDSGLLSDTGNLDFTAIPYWGEEDCFENNWSGKRSKALPSILAAIAHDPDTGIICYGDTTIRHNNSDQIIIEFLDFYSENYSKEIKYLTFDSKFTTYEQ